MSFCRLRQCCGHLNLLQNKFDPEVLEKEKQDVAIEDLFQSLSIQKSRLTYGNVFQFEILRFYRICDSCSDSRSEVSFHTDEYAKQGKAHHFEKTAPSSKLTFILSTIQEIRFRFTESFLINRKQQRVELLKNFAVLVILSKSGLKKSIFLFVRLPIAVTETRRTSL